MQIYFSILLGHVLIGHIAPDLCHCIDPLFAPLIHGLMQCSAALQSGLRCLWCVLSEPLSCDLPYGRRKGLEHANPWTLTPIALPYKDNTTKGPYGVYYEVDALVSKAFHFWVGGSLSWARTLHTSLWVVCSHSHTLTHTNTHSPTPHPHTHTHTPASARADAHRLAEVQTSLLERCLLSRNTLQSEDATAPPSSKRWVAILSLEQSPCMRPSKKHICQGRMLVLLRDGEKLEFDRLPTLPGNWQRQEGR